MPKHNIRSAMSTSRQGHFTENAPGRVNRGKDGEETGLPHACKTSPDIACIVLLGSPRQSENIKEWRGGACLRTMAKMKGFDPEGFNLERRSKSRLARAGRQRNRWEAADQLGRIQSDDVSAASARVRFLGAGYR